MKKEGKDENKRRRGSEGSRSTSKEARDSHREVKILEPPDGTVGQQIQDVKDE